MRYTDLNAPPEQAMAQVVAELRAKAEAPATGAHGVKDLGESGDVTWAGATGTRSIRDVDTEVADAQARIDEASQSLAESREVIAAAINPDGTLRDEAVTAGNVLQHAVLLGDTIVQNINVTGKLIGTDGVFTGTVDFANVNVTGTQIVNKLDANSIAADKISGGSFAGKTFTGGFFEGARFTGGTFQTRHYPSQYGGVQINGTNGLRAWNSSGQQTVSIDPSVGALRMGEGIYLTDASRNGLVLNPPSKIGTASIFFTAGEVMDENSAAIWRLGYSTGKSPLMLRGANGEGITVKGGSTLLEGNLAVEGITNLGATVVSGYLTLKAPPTTAQAANAFINPSNGVVARSTSSRRYKQAIKDWNPSTDAVLALRPRSWEAIVPGPGEAEGTRYVGLIAEEVEDLGLTELVGHDDQGRPDWLHYPLLAVAQQAVIRDHEARIARLEATLATTDQTEATE